MFDFVTKMNLQILLVWILLVNVSFASLPIAGNFALNESQQPGPLFSFGQFSIDQNESQFFINLNDISGFNLYQTNISPGFIYGLTDDLTAQLSLPIITKNYSDPFHSSGISDFFAAFEYTFLENRSNYLEQATLVTTATFPTGNAAKNPPTGLGAPSLFIGSTYSKMYEQWYWFLAPGITWIAPSSYNNFDHIILYNAGIGKNLFFKTNQYYWHFLTELNGLYAQHNNLFISPSLIFATKNLYLQTGVSLALISSRINPVNYNFGFSGTWTFS